MYFPRGGYIGCGKGTHLALGSSPDECRVARPSDGGDAILVARETASRLRLDDRFDEQRRRIGTGRHLQGSVGNNDDFVAGLRSYSGLLTRSRRTPQRSGGVVCKKVKGNRRHLREAHHRRCCRKTVHTVVVSFDDHRRQGRHGGDITHPSWDVTNRQVVAECGFDGIFFQRYRGHQPCKTSRGAC